MKIKGIQVPKMVVNISKLFSIMRATTKTTVRITKDVNMIAVCNGVV